MEKISTIIIFIVLFIIAFSFIGYDLYCKYKRYKREKLLLTQFRNTLYENQIVSFVTYNDYKNKIYKHGFIHEIEEDFVTILSRKTNGSVCYYVVKKKDIYQDAKHT